MKKINFILFVFIITAYSLNPVYPQLIHYMIPDTGSQNTVFPVTIAGSETYWSFSSYVEIYFDTIGVSGSNVVIINDTTLHASVIVEGIASLGYHKLIVSDQFLNIVKKDSALFVRLSAPVAPNLLSPPNNFQIANTNQLFLWDTNLYANTFQIQISSDSTFSNLVKDTTKPNIQGYRIPDILQLNTYYWWRVKFFNLLGESPWSAVFKFKTRTTGINIIGTNIPEIYKLYDNYPNPFNPYTKIKFDLPQKDYVKLIIFDITGKEIAVLVNQLLGAATYEINWNASNYPSGIYFYRIMTNSFSFTKKMVLIK